MFDYNILVITIVTIICLICFYCMHVFSKNSNVNQIIHNASLESEFSPTIFKIYDKSSKEVCNRIIIISPFEWYLWACNNELFVLNPEGGIRCSAGSCPAVQIFKDRFVETCLGLNFNSILQAYVIGKIPTIIPYEIESNIFTILSALDILKEKWITFNVGQNNKSLKIVNLKHRSQRSLSGRDFIKLLNSNHNSPNIQKLHKMYIKHMYKLHPSINEKE